MVASCCTVMEATRLPTKAASGKLAPAARAAHSSSSGTIAGSRGIDRPSNPHCRHPCDLRIAKHHSLIPAGNHHGCSDKLP